ncbi:hypothetical protein [Haloarcula sp. Atlit-120R]|uniref:hypothetical protein n=1 Tax=Haloarcula sp. Atlit-120R TaxID=2282135 RepID=UPI000EF27412|nr:hypothetical protein [Haloarcula sp. Atlit-120R]RLM32667.1 hypothetical protein DVK01_20565 [Haloarcula sp. Atlit-120R]
MSKATQGAPAKRKERPDEIADENTPVKVERLSGDSMLGIVRERTEYDAHGAPARVLVEGADTTVNVAAGQVSVARGSNADVVRSLVGGQEDV